MREIDKKMLNDIETIMEQESQNRNKIFKDVETKLAAHSQKLVEYDRVAKEHDLLKIKYKSLKKEYKENEELRNKQVSSLKENLENVEHENKMLKKIVMNQKRKISGLQSIVELVVNDYGIQNIQLVTGLSIDKIKEYFQD